MSRTVLAEAAQLVKACAARNKPLKKAAILLNCLSSEVLVEVARAFTECEMKQLTPEVTKLPCARTVESVAVVSEFFCIHRLWSVVGGDLEDSREILKALDSWAGANPRKLARLLRESWMSPRV